MTYKRYGFSVTLFANTDISTMIKIVYYTALISMSPLGIIEIFIQNFKNEKRITICNNCSIILHGMVIFIFTFSQQP